MKSLLTTLFAIFICLNIFAQSPVISKIILKNGDAISGEIQELKPGAFVKIKVVGNNILEIPYADIDNIIMDASKATNPEKTIAPIADKKVKSELKDFYFQTFNEFAFGLGAGKVNGYKFEDLTGVIPNSDTYAGFYTANGVGYKNMLFAGIGMGFNGHQGLSDFDDQNFSYALPFTLDVRYRVLPTSKISPLVMAAVGMSYYEGSLGTFTFMDGVGASIQITNRFESYLLFSHTYDRFSSSLSVNNSTLEQFYSGIYLNYIGARIGVTYKI